VVVNSGDIDLSCGFLVLDVRELLSDLRKARIRICQIGLKQAQCLLEGQLHDGIGAEPEAHVFEIVASSTANEDALADEEVHIHFFIA